MCIYIRVYAGSFLHVHIYISVIINVIASNSVAVVFLLILYFMKLYIYNNNYINIIT